MRWAGPDSFSRSGHLRGLLFLLTAEGRGGQKPPRPRWPSSPSCVGLHPWGGLLPPATDPGPRDWGGALEQPIYFSSVIPKGKGHKHRLFIQREREAVVAGRLVAAGREGPGTRAARMGAVRSGAGAQEGGSHPLPSSEQRPVDPRDRPGRERTGCQKPQPALGMWGASDHTPSRSLL